MAEDQTDKRGDILTTRKNDLKKYIYFHVVVLDLRKMIFEGLSLGFRAQIFNKVHTGEISFNTSVLI